MISAADVQYRAFDCLATPGRKRTMDIPPLPPLEAREVDFITNYAPSLRRELYFFCNTQDRLLAREMTCDEYCEATLLTPKGFYWLPKERNSVDASLFLLADAVRHGTWTMVEELTQRNRFSPEVVEFIRDGAYPGDVFTWLRYRLDPDLGFSVGKRLEWAGQMAASEALLDIPRRAQALRDFYEETCAATAFFEKQLPENSLWLLPLFRQAYRDRVHSEWVAYGQEVARRIPGGSAVMLSCDTLDLQIGHIVPKRDVRVGGSFFPAHRPLTPLPEGVVLEKPDYVGQSLIVLGDLLAAERMVELASQGS